MGFGVEVTSDGWAFGRIHGGVGEGVGGGPDRKSEADPLDFRSWLFVCVFLFGVLKHFAFVIDISILHFASEC